MENESVAMAGEPTVIFEDDSIIVLNKPSGLPVHPDGRHERATLADWLVIHYPELKGVGETQTLPNGTVIERPGIVHRIDADTSGIIVIARTQKSFEFLKEQFQNREVKKVYRAFVYGPLKDERGIINRPIGSSRGGRGPRSATRAYGNMRDAETLYHTVTSGKEAAYVEAFPKTGRTHQIRVHFSAIQHPIICDKLYAPNRPPLLGFTRLALHALSLAFQHPKKGKVIFEAPLPADFVHAEAQLRES
ncbi:MAG TPA: RluA family pseudouridine synthase [Candidatus Paceibacterota bacterium]|nr:RluA family pseudouridine synthase [Candidatus Paceibacterota bacterium]